MTIRARPMRTTAVLLCLLLLSLLSAAPARPARAQQPGSGWRDTGVAIPGPEGHCMDPTQPNVLLVNERGGGSAAYNWQTGQRQFISQRRFDLCGPQGLLYSRQPDGSAWRFSLGDPTGRAIQFMPTHVAQDGSQRVYALNNGQLWASADGGSSWQQRGQQLASKPYDLALIAADARALYLLTHEDVGSTPTRWWLYFSADAGQTWQLRFDESTKEHLMVNTFHSTAASANTLWIVRKAGISPGSQRLVHLSIDGGRSFNYIGSQGGNVPYPLLQIVHTHLGVLALDLSNSQQTKLRLTSDGGKTWQDLPVPAPGNPDNRPFYHRFSMDASAQAPANVFIDIYPSLWYSPDGGHSWQEISREQPDLHCSPALTPYLPLSVLCLTQSIHGGPQMYLQVLDLPNAGRFNTVRVPAKDAPGSRYFPQTGHSIAPVFLPYWDSRGGLAQFGYPRTEAFFELNPADNKVYLVQYFERNRFEYHPELAGTEYEVLLGLLGRQLTEHRRAAGEGAFNRFDDPRQPGVLYFPETGHSLRNSFKAYWEANGGLRFYGYPISEEFHEVNPDDGKTYVVQYFERARFEWHPEHKGTRYEVLLGLLGNTLLREKGWEPVR